ncbi:MAG: FtsK/SpoIIIE family protein [Fibrobacteria bacterium]|nr:FtsK/SpoIIIE family protein [Fibrobacteria bacterium]
MAKADKKSARPSSAAKGRGRAAEEEEESSGAHPEIPGLILLSGMIVTFTALVSERVQKGHNLLGPYVGSAWANFLNNAFGSLPVLLYLAAIVLLGVQLLFKVSLWRQMSITAAVGFFVGLLLSIRNLNPQVTWIDYPRSGGWVGNFLAQQIFTPVFGTESRVGPYLVTSLLIFLLTVWGFQISVSAWLKRGAHAAGAMGRSLAEGWRSGAGNGAAEAQEGPWKGSPAMPVLAKAPRRSRAEGKVSNESLIPTEDDSPEEEKAKLEALLESGDLENLDPLTIRKLRDLALERKRVTELNDWEEKTRSTEIGGMLSRNPKGSAGSSKAPPAEAAEASFSELLDPEEEEADEEARVDSLDEADEDEIPPPPPKKAGKASSRPSKAKTLANTKERGTPWDDEGGEDPEGAPALARVQYDEYKRPDLDRIFPTPPVQALEFTEEELLEQKTLLEAQLNNFKVRGKVTGIHPGPVITRYEVELAPGEKVNRISSLSDDLALALRAKSIRILAPIPGKSLVGVEVPNRKAQIVYIKEILGSPEFAMEKDTLKVCLGKTISGEPYVADLTRAPHLLIAGQTGSGKSVCINSIMASLLASKTPAELRMILIDPKVVELKPYDSIPHLLRPVITQAEAAVQALKWATVKMDERYEKLAKSGVRNIKGFNEKARAGTLNADGRYTQNEEFGDGFEARYTDDDPDSGLPVSEEMPYILIVIDELADLMMVAGKEVETNIARIAQKARAVGIHLILATQRPSTNVITGTIKANLPTRIAFQVASQIDARTILDRQGAEKLLGRGDMLYRPIEFPEPVRLHGCFIDDAQCEDIAGECAGQNVNFPQVKSFNVDEDSAAEAVDEERDSKFAEAAELVVQLKQASVSLLQRRLGLGYARSGRLVDQLERAGVVGRERGSKPREVLMNEEELHGFLSSHDATEGA